MTESLLYNQEEECVKNMTEKNEDIASVIEGVIKQVQQQKLDKVTTAIFEGIDDSDILKNNDSLTSSKSSDSVIDRSKQHRSGSRKFRIRHNKKRKWKPYCKLTWEERKKLEERDSRRAYRSRERMSASGLTLAPYNTTQFLMEDHNLQEPDYESIHHDKTNKDDCHSYDSEEDFYSSPEDEEEFLHQQFSETYDSFHTAYLNGMTKFELVSELMRLEDKVEEVEQSLKECRETKKKRLLSECPNLDVEAELAKIQIFLDEIKKLTQENHTLEKKNEMLQNRLAVLKAT